MPRLSEVASPADIASLRAAIQPNLDRCRAVVVNSDGDREVASLLIHATKPLSTKLDNARKQINRAFKTEIDGRFQPVISEIDEAVGVASNARAAYDRKVLEAARERQRLLDEQAAKERAELERRQKIQDAAVEAGKQARKEIPAPETVAAPLVANPHEDTRRIHYRLKYTVSDVQALPDELTNRVANARAIYEKVLEIEKTYDKDRKGLDEPRQEIPGLELRWDAVYNDM